jgi:anti-sigma factor RsiW
MDCTQARFGLYALLDNELDIGQNLELLSHLEGCLACQQELELEARLKAVVRDQLFTVPPSPDLWQNVLQRIEREGARHRSWSSAIRSSWLRVRPPQAVAAVLALLAIGTLALLVFFPQGASALLMQELVIDHLRAATKPEGPVEVPAHDPAAIVAWFHDKISTPSSVPVLALADAKLIGGSFCQFSQTKGIRFTYALRKGQTISLYQLERSEVLTTPSSAPRRMLTTQVQGLGIVLWGEARLLYALVADLPIGDLQRLASHVGGV